VTAEEEEAVEAEDVVTEVIEAAEEDAEVAKITRKTE